MIGLILVILALAVLFDKLPGNQVAWLVVLVCGLVALAAGIPDVPAWIAARRKPQA